MPLMTGHSAKAKNHSANSLLREQFAYLCGHVQVLQEAAWLEWAEHESSAQSERLSALETFLQVFVALEIHSARTDPLHPAQTVHW